MNASVGVLNHRPKIIVSSGGRVLDERDYGAMVLRSSGDILNFCKVVLGLNLKGGISSILCEHTLEAVERGRNRKKGKLCAGAATYQLSDEAGILRESDEGESDNDHENVDVDTVEMDGKHSKNEDDDGFLRLLL
jgi:hypothetical protein